MTAGFENVDQVNVEELFQSCMEELSSANLLELEKELNDGDDESSNVKPVNIFQQKQLTEFFKHIDTVTGIRDDHNANRERTAKVTRVIGSAMACYKEFYSERQKAESHLSIHHSFKRVESYQSTGSARELVQYECVPHSPASFESSDCIMYIYCEVSNVVCIYKP
jgi:hypothetical protein